MAREHFLLIWVIVPVSDESEAPFKKMLTLMLITDLKNGQNERNFKKGLGYKSNTNDRCLYPWLIINT